MSITTLTSREFNQDTGRAKKAADAGPVFITDRGRPAHVLLSIEEYRRLAGSDRSIADALAMDEDLDFDPPRSKIVFTPPDLG
ncbi:type II toxin-antitoxin system Phd/YefM family antitoxin [Reyranella sp.]|uniref:type II toxin-antitoxin system Phd/YefM family antitoxin n=1 Tax=Reyranella sp. TaxID=1929291 RepID=UPI003D12E3BB